ncbi:MAG TPA: 1-(5-phosphoribosyl)-5-[(5-phosphoribosylamino)methylideneamino]imidazole-4-carboxamide isomerase [Thermoleophilia bacterium]|nr:1-(5-phosphoribosyl)-5-[(5-phosphoribosylamino)methylideneamino]imidazole-4-carboxamide isomerase [Thermoleophilia bacterium]
MRLFPAIDIQGGRCVRLRRGDFSDETIFSHDPVEVARRWVESGARSLHVVDLDGAREGDMRNLPLVAAIAEAVTVPVQFGGGIRSEAALDRLRGTAVNRIIVGTGALLDEGFLRAALADWGSRLIVAVDAEDGFVSTHGWRQRSGMSASSFVRQLAESGIREVIYTDIDRDGMLGGMNLKAIEELVRSVPEMEVIASGGLTSLQDLRALKRLEPVGVTGVIAGRALYEKIFTLQQALDVLDGIEP